MITHLSMIMIYILLLTMKIYNKNNKAFTLLFTALLIITICADRSFAQQSGHIEYNSALFDYSKLNVSKLKKDADLYFDMFNKTKSKKEKNLYLNAAQNKYYIITKAEPSNIEAYAQLGRIYGIKNRPRLAKEYFFKATNINAYDPFANFYFGEFYFNKQDYKRALKHYNIAYNNGYNTRYELNLRLATIYEKFADLINAKKFYEVLYSMKPDAEIQKKIQLLNELNYDKSEYYHIIRE